MAIVDGRTLEDNANAVGTAWVGIGGTTPNQDTDTFVEGTASVATTADSTGGTEGLAWDNEADFDGTDRIYYLWVNIANPGQMETKANGGIKVHVAGVTATNFVERYFEGSDTYSGGWKMFIIDMNDVFQNFDNSGGTPPVITAIRRIGITVDISGSLMPKMQDNLFLDAIWSLAKGTPGIRVEGDNGGDPWTWQDIVDAGDRFDPTKAWGHIQQANSIIQLLSSIQFGDAAGVTATDFVDTSGAVVVFGEGANPLPDDIYEVTVVGNATLGTDVDFGAVVGSGDDRQGIGGTSWLTGGPLFTFDGETDIAEVTTLNIYGGNFRGAGTIKFSGSTKTDVIGATFVGCGEVQQNDAEFLNNTIIAPSDRGVEMLSTHNMKQISFIAGDNTNQVATFGTPTDNVDASPIAAETFSHTVASGQFDVALLVLVGFEHTADDINSITYDGVPLRKIGEVSNGTTITVEAWILYGPAEGSSLTVSVNFDTAPDNVAVRAINLEGVNRFSEISVASGTATAATALAVTQDNVSIDSFSIDMIYADVSGPGTTFVATAGTATETNDAAVGAEASYAVSEDVAGVALRDHDWTWTGSANAAQLMVVVKSIGVEHHVHLPNIGDATVTFDDMQFFGFGAAGAPKWHGDNSESGADITINATNGSNPAANEFELTNSTPGTIVISNPVTTLVNVKDGAGVDLQNARVLFEAKDGTGDFPFEESVTITRSGSVASVAHTAHDLLDGDIAVIRGADQQEYNGPFTITNVTTNAYDYTVSGTPDTPATGTIISSGAILNGVTDVNGDISVARTFTLSTPCKGFVRKSTASPRFKSLILDDTVSSANGLTINVRLTADE